MEISGVAPSPYAPPQVREPLVSEAKVKVQAVAESYQSRVAPDVGGNKRSLDAQARLAEADRLRTANQAVTNPQDEQQTRETQQAQLQQALQAGSGGSIQFEFEDSTRIMKVLDSKDVLIYQVPPKGALTLIKNLEGVAAPRVNTSA